MAKENKFTRSVLERLEQQAETQKQQQLEKKEPTAQEKQPPTKDSRILEKGSTSKEEPSLPKETKAEPKPKKEPPKESVKDTAKKKAKEEAPQEAQEAPDLSQWIRPTPTRVAKNKTFYLDEEVIIALQKSAKAQKMTDSRLANEIFRQVLGLNIE